MEVILIFNGLGNQMSQYAFYLAKQKKCKHCFPIFYTSTCAHNGSELENIFGIKYPNNLYAKIASFIYKHYRSNSYFAWAVEKLGVKIVREPLNYDFHDKYISKRGNGLINYYLGGWHSDKYFNSIAADIKNVFSFNISKEEQSFQDACKTIQSDLNSESLHVRRGDYLTSKDPFYKFSGVATEEYYIDAIKYIKKYVSNPTFYVFSDDIEWCKKTFKGENIIIVEGNFGKKSWRDMCMMSMCHHHINANSTFSWWGAWLGETPDSITICPHQFIRDVETKDIYPDRWIKL